MFNVSFTCLRPSLIISEFHARACRFERRQSPLLSRARLVQPSVQGGVHSPDRTDWKLNRGFSLIIHVWTNNIRIIFCPVVYFYPFLLTVTFKSYCWIFNILHSFFFFPSFLFLTGHEIFKLSIKYICMNLSKLNWRISYLHSPMHEKK